MSIIAGTLMSVETPTVSFHMRRSRRAKRKLYALQSSAHASARRLRLGRGKSARCELLLYTLGVVFLYHVFLSSPCSSSSPLNMLAYVFDAEAATAECVAFLHESSHAASVPDSRGIDMSHANRLTLISGIDSRRSGSDSVLKLLGRAGECNSECRNRLRAIAEQIHP